jgi:FSR family fosmidomycin resistance protein-like MFS transporter
MSSVAIEEKSNPQTTAMAVLAALSASHMLNDTMQSLLPSIYPILKDSYALDFGQIGLITLAFQLTASILQPLVGLVIDRHPMPYSAAAGMGLSVAGIALLAFAHSFAFLLLAACLIGLGSSIFHPESSRIARLASGGRHGFAQSLFQVGGNVGSAIGPLAAALIILPFGQASVSWFTIIGVIAMILLSFAGRWYAVHGARRAAAAPLTGAETLPRKRVVAALFVLIALVFSKFFYMASLGNYLTFYLIETFHVSVQSAQLYLFVFLAAVAAGTFLGGPIGDRFGRKYVIWFSILGVLPFTLALPHADLFWTLVLAVVIGLIMSSAFSAILVYAQELMPGRVGLVAGLFFGLAFGMGGLGAALLGELADLTSIGFVFGICAWLPAIGVVCWFLPDLKRRAVAKAS